MNTHTLNTDGASISYDVRPADGHGRHRPLLIVGSPMDASGFVTLAGHFTDRTVITYDPRGAGRSRRTDGRLESTPVEHAADLAAMIEAVGGPVDVFASSGGSVNALELVSGRPELVHTLVAHEPPSAQLLEDRAEVVATCEAIYDTYQRSGMGPAMAAFIALTAHEGPLPQGFSTQPGPDPATFGLPTADDGTRNDVLVGQNIRTCSPHEIDLVAVRSGATRVIIGVGEDSGQQLAARGATALARELGGKPAAFPGDHSAFLGGEYGMTGQPDAFAARLRELLDATG